MNIKQLRKLIRETILHESSFSVNSDVDRAFNSVGVYPPKMVSVGGDCYEGEIDKGWKLTYDEKSGSIDVNGQSFNSLLDAAKFYKKNKGKKISASSSNQVSDHIWKYYIDDVVDMYRENPDVEADEIADDVFRPGGTDTLEEIDELESDDEWMRIIAQHNLSNDEREIVMDLIWGALDDRRRQIEDDAALD